MIGVEAEAMENTEGSKQLEQIAPSQLARAVERGLERVGDEVWVGLKRHPYFGVVVTAGATLGAASLLGIAELLLTVGAGYAAYQVLKLNVPPSLAIRRVAKVEKGLF
jgi:hypothetical protein